MSEHLYAQMQIEKKKITAMHRIASSTTARDVKQTLNTILEACMDCLSIEKGSVMIFANGYLTVEAALGKNSAQLIGQVQEISEKSVSGRCFITRKPIFIQNIKGEDGLQGAGDGSQYMNDSLISMPLISLVGKNIGVLNVSKTSAEIFSEQDVDILTDLAQEASATLGHEIAMATLYRSFQEVFVEAKQAREQLQRIEEKIVTLLGSSWPAMAEEEGQKQ